MMSQTAAATVFVSSSTVLVSPLSKSLVATTRPPPPPPSTRWRRKERSPFRGGNGIPSSSCSSFYRVIGIRDGSGSRRFCPRSSSSVVSLSDSTSSSSSVGKVFDVGPPRSFDSHGVGSPVVKRFIGDDEDRWFMWYHGTDGTTTTTTTTSDTGVPVPSGLCCSIGLASSKDGIHWDRGIASVKTTDDLGQVMHRSSDWWVFDTQSIIPSDVLIRSSDKLRSSTAVYWLYYTGSNVDKIEIPTGMASSPPGRGSTCCLKSLPGLAISQDGRHWARIEGEHHSGALFDAGAADQWDSLFVAAPKVVYHRLGDLRMYYHSFDTRNGHYAIGIARSQDGIKWVKLGKILGSGSAGSFDEAGVRNGCVVWDQKRGAYVMAYEGVSLNGQTSIGMAESLDGLKDWKRCGDQAILLPSEEENGWDEWAVGAPCLVQMDGKNEWRLYYEGISMVGMTRIGMAVSTGPEVDSFARWD